MEACCEYGNEHLCSVNAGYFLPIVFLETEDCEGVILYAGRTVHRGQCNHYALTHTTYEVQRMVRFSTYHSQ